MSPGGIRQYHAGGNVIECVERWCIVVSCGGMWKWCDVLGPLAM